MSNEALEVAQQKIHDLELKIRALMGSNEELRLLPNGDLHRGIRLADANKPNVETEVITYANPLNRVMSDVLKAAKGGHALTCLHCGLQWEGQGAEKEVRDHYKRDHPTVVEGHDAVAPELLMASLEEARARLAEAEKVNA